MFDPGRDHGEGYAICDTHFHIFGPFNEFPLGDGASYFPDEATVTDYKLVARELRVGRAVIVQGGCYGTNNAVTINAVRELGIHRAKAIAIIDDGFSQSQLEALRDAGVRGIRLNLISDRSIDAQTLIKRARQVAPLGWHIQLHATSNQIANLAHLLRTLSVDIVIDHCGYLDSRCGVDHPEFKAILDLLLVGNTWIKLTSYRAGAFEGRRLSMEPVVERLADVAPDRCLWGTDWPHTLIAEKPQTADLLSEFKTWVPPSVARKVLVDNPRILYGFHD